MDMDGLVQEIRALRHTLTQEIGSLRQEVQALKQALGVSPGGDTGGTAPAGIAAWLPAMPEALARRLRPWLEQSIPSEARERARWLLELSENVEDYQRYEGDDWLEAPEFAARLQELQEKCGLERMVPREGDTLDERLHLVLQSLPNPEKRDTVARCARPGFRFDGDILRRAEVVVYL